MKLLIVESPTKAKTISRFVGSDFDVVSSKGHIRDLPKSKMGVDTENNFEPTYIIPTDAKATVKSLKEKAKKSDEIYFATDEDREGEAISWHLENILKPAKGEGKRIVFHEITKKALDEALKSPRELNLSLVDAQQARRILDRLVGYELSPFLWKKVARGLSAGRVQSAAMRIIAKREEEINAFKPQKYFGIDIEYEKDNIVFPGKLEKIAGKKVDKLEIDKKSKADEILEKLNSNPHTVERVSKSVRKKSPSAPFTTSTLQQEASKKLGYSSKQTMMLAQQLYEGIEIGSEGRQGLITYMRTDSTNLATEAVDEIRKTIETNFGKDYLATEPRVFKKKNKNAQEAHEAIRPTLSSRLPESIKQYLEPKQFNVYRLIWERTVACQMQEAEFDAVSVDIKSADVLIRANGNTVKFDGFLKVYRSGNGEKILPEFKEKDEVKPKSIKSEEKSTEPPARYTEAGLIKALEEEGIGRPSTYAPTISTIIARKYIEKNIEDKKLYPTEIGILVDKVMKEHFPKIVDLKFTAFMEEELDKIANGEKKWQPVIGDFYKPFKENLTEKEKTVDKKALTEETTDKKCEKCGSPMVIKMGRFGKFLACSKYPECKNTKQIDKNGYVQKEETTNKKCSKCGKPMVIKYGRFGKFLGCSGYPECKNIEGIENKTGVKCPECKKGDIVIRRSKRGRIFYGCNKYPDCKFALWQKPINELCPKCKSILVIQSKNKIKCSNKECDFMKEQK